MCLHARLDRVLKEREIIAEELGVSSKTNKRSITIDVIKSLVYRLEYLESEGLLTPCAYDQGCLLVQLLADASQIIEPKTRIPRQWFYDPFTLIVA